ncbi:uncharacterized protein SOCE836_090650 [Sorangium cellulosum]|uniref:Uncharacterized protein n=2 Tax=Sorangium cellulosum TaxID=56 RepID=A0A4P2R1M8_SORCE|nr:uncharacterized protein SOCE836_090650 [Sorangium cellulosum]
MSRQNGHSKSAHSTIVTGASGGPISGEPSVASVFTLFASKRMRNASSRSFFDRPSLTCLSRSCAAGRHALQGRCSFTHCAMLTGVSGQGERSSETWAPHSRRSRGVSEEVSTPGSETDTSGAGAGLGSLEPELPGQPVTPIESNARSGGIQRRNDIAARA